MKFGKQRPLFQRLDHKMFEPVLHSFYLFYFIIYFILSFVFLETYPRHMEVPRLGDELELQLPAYTTATATPGP